MTRPGAGKRLDPNKWKPAPGKGKPLQQDTADDVVSRYHRAWTNGDIDTAMEYVADDVECRAPGADLHGIEAYRAFIAGFAPQLTGIENIAAFADTDHVALFYYPQTAATATTPAAEYFTVRDGKISESILVFDRLSHGPPPQD